MHMQWMLHSHVVGHEPLWCCAVAKASMQRQKIMTMRSITIWYNYFYWAEGVCEHIKTSACLSLALFSNHFIIWSWFSSLFFLSMMFVSEIIVQFTVEQTSAGYVLGRGYLVIGKSLPWWRPSLIEPFHESMVRASQKGGTCFNAKLCTDS